MSDEPTSRKRHKRREHMKLRSISAVVLALGACSAISCADADVPVDQKAVAGALGASTCGGPNLWTQNPSVQNAVMTWTLPGLTWHSNVTLMTDLHNRNETLGFMSFEIDRPSEAPRGTWPLFTSGVRVNGTSISAIMPGESPGLMYYFEGATQVSGPFPGGDVSMSGVIYNGQHQLLGTFSTAVGVSGGTNQWLVGIPPVCPSSAPRTLHSPFHYNLEVCCGANGSVWVQGNVTASQNGAYVQLNLSNPNIQTHETWSGDAACVIDPSGLLQCNVHTGQDGFSGDVGDPLWTVKDVVNGYMYPYHKEWDYEGTSDNQGGQLYLDFYGF